MGSEKLNDIFFRFFLFIIPSDLINTTHFRTRSTSGSYAFSLNSARTPILIAHCASSALAGAFKSKRVLYNFPIAFSNWPGNAYLILVAKKGGQWAHKQTFYDKNR